MKRKLSALFAVVFIAAALLSVSMPAAADDANDAVLNACNSVVRFYCSSSATGRAQIGSGFAVGKAGQPVELIITNHHVVSDDNGNICDEVLVVMENINMLATTLTGEVVYYDAAVDFAIVRIAPTSLRVPITLMSATHVKRTQTVYALGFPGVSDDISDSGLSLPSTVEDVTITRGTISKTNATTGGASFLQMDTVINGGNSGGPLVTENGYCVGINTFGAVNGDGTFGAMYIDYVMNILNENGIAYEVTEDGAPSGTAVPAAPGGNTDTPSVNVDGEPANLMWLWILIAVLVIGGVAAVIIVVSVKKSPSAASASAPYVVPAAPASGTPGVPPAYSGPVRPFAIEGVTGYFAGNSVPVPTGSTVTIGRNAQLCNLVFPSDTPGISSRHCCVASNGDKLQLTDLGSTYGTFTADAVRLTPNVPVLLDVGSKFYLGDPSNTFVVR